MGDKTQTKIGLHHFSICHLVTLHLDKGWTISGLLWAMCRPWAVAEPWAAGEQSDEYFVTMNHSEGVDERWRGWARLALTTKSAAKAVTSMLTKPAWEWPLNYYLFWTLYWTYKMCTYEFMFSFLVEENDDSYLFGYKGSEWRSYAGGNTGTQSNMRQQRERLLTLLIHCMIIVLSSFLYSITNGWLAWNWYKLVLTLSRLCPEIVQQLSIVCLSGQWVGGEWAMGNGPRVHFQSWTKAGHKCDICLIFVQHLSMPWYYDVERFSEAWSSWTNNGQKLDFRMSNVGPTFV